MRLLGAKQSPKVSTVSILIWPSNVDRRVYSGLYGSPVRIGHLIHDDSQDPQSWFPMTARDAIGTFCPTCTTTAPPTVGIATLSSLSLIDPMVSFSAFAAFWFHRQFRRKPDYMNTDLRPLRWRVWRCHPAWLSGQSQVQQTHNMTHQRHIGYLLPWPWTPGVFVAISVNCSRTLPTVGSVDRRSRGSH